jgi:hypothetical protein
MGRLERWGIKMGHGHYGYPRVRGMTQTDVF